MKGHAYLHVCFVGEHGSCGDAWLSWFSGCYFLMVRLFLGTHSLRDACRLHGYTLIVSSLHILARSRQAGKQAYTGISGGWKRGWGEG